MGADRSAYAVLGLEPGADAAAIERAYRRLIKQHHPDRGGGDTARAVELNRAYRELRRAYRMKDEFTLHDRAVADPARRGLMAGAILVAIVVVVVAVRLAPNAANFVESSPPSAKAGAAADIMARPLATAAIDAAVVEAVRLSQAGDEMALTERSRTCHSDLRLSPELAKFDRCVAFDDAVVRLQDRDPLRDRGTFSQLSVTGRQWAAAAPLSSNYLATDSRLKQIRVKVDVLLAPVSDR